jgi:hypothetical protein
MQQVPRHGNRIASHYTSNAFLGANAMASARRANAYDREQIAWFKNNCRRASEFDRRYKKKAEPKFRL